MEGNERTDSGGSGVVKSERESPAKGGRNGCTGGGVCGTNGGGNGSSREGLQDTNMGMEREAVAVAGIVTGRTEMGIGGNEFPGRKKRGRPRKYDSDGNLLVSYASPKPEFHRTPPCSGGSASSKRGLGRQSGSGNWQALASLGELFATTAGADFTPHAITVCTGEDVASKLLSVFQKGPRGICVLTANGTVSNVTIRQPGSSGGFLRYEGWFEILTLSGSFTISENGVEIRGGGLSISLAGADGRVIGGSVAGSLLAANPIQMIVGSFVPNGYTTHKKKHRYGPRIEGAPQVPTSLVTVLSRGEVNNDEKISKDNPNNPSSSGAIWNGSAHSLDQGPSTDINVSAPME